MRKSAIKLAAGLAACAVTITSVNPGGAVSLAAADTTTSLANDSAEGTVDAVSSTKNTDVGDLASAQGSASSQTSDTAADASSSDDTMETSNTPDKEEVVYIVTDATGAVDSINVVNIFGKGDVTDYGDYSAVKMLTSTDAITQNGDEITFSTDSDRVYYQGTMENAQIPWNIRISYTLDGKSITPEELAGQSGVMEIHIQITENIACAYNYFENYALQAAFTLDTTKCTSIDAPDATAANVGADKQLSYTVLPGKGLDTTIRANVTDFEMDAASINGVSLHLDVDVDDAELIDKVSEIMDAAVDFNDGAVDLVDGVADLKDGGSSLNDGAQSLQDGASDLHNGISDLQDGISSVQDGLDTLNAQSSALTTGSDQVAAALSGIQSALGSTDSADTLCGGAASLSASASYEAYASLLQQNGVDPDALMAANDNAAATISAQIDSLNAALEQITSIPSYEEDPSAAAQAAQLESQISSLNSLLPLFSGNNAVLGATRNYLDGLHSGAAALSDNLNTLSASVQELNGKYAELNTGIQSYTAGAAALSSGNAQVADGAQKLSEGSNTLLSGTKDLKKGTQELCDGISELSDGTDELYDGTQEFYDKTCDMDTQTQDTIDDMISSISGDDADPVSFASAKNTDVKAVQFVIKTTAIQKTAEAAPAAEETAPTGFWQKLVQLFHKD